MHARITTLLGLMLISLLSHSQKNEVYFPYFELVNLQDDGELQYSASRLMKTYIESNNQYTVVVPDHDRYTYRTPGNIDDAISEAKQQGSEYLLVAEIHKLESTFIVSVAVYEVATQEKKWNDMIKGLTSDDLDPLLSRLGRAFMTKNKARDDVEIGEVSSYEQQGVELQQIHANHYFGAMVGVNSIIGDEALSGFGFAYSFDANTILFNVNLDYYFSSNDLDSDIADERMEMGSFNLGLMYPFTRKRMTWYANGGMDYSFVKVFTDDSLFETSETGGVGLFAGLGYLINRNSTVNFRIQSNIYFPTYRLGDSYHPSLRISVTTSISK